MFCPKCGKENPASANHCAFCGAEIKAAAAATPAPAPAIDASQIAADATSKITSVPKKVWIGIAGGVVALIAIVALFVVMTGALTLGQTSESFKQALMQNSIVTNGIASSTYLDESPYTITSYSCGNIKVEKEPNLGIESATTEINVTIDNDNYTTEAVMEGVYYSFENSGLGTTLGADSSYSFSVVSSNTTPKKGIDFAKYQAANSSGTSSSSSSSKSGKAETTIGESVLSEDKMSCTVSESIVGSYWFADSSVDTVHEFTFDGKAWKATSQADDPTHKVTYKDINGEYKGKTGTPANFVKFTVRDLDAAKGTFAIDYSYSKKITASGAIATATGTVTATIDPQKTGNKYEMTDGYAYYFEAKGNSDGGNGQASLAGYLTTSDSGEDCIEISKASVDYTYPEGVIAFTSTPSFSDISGPLYK